MSKIWNKTVYYKFINFDWITWIIKTELQFQLHWSSHLIGLHNCHWSPARVSQIFLHTLRVTERHLMHSEALRFGWKLLGFHTEIWPCWLTPLAEMAITPSIYMLQTWFACQKFVTSNLWTCEPCKGGGENDFCWTTKYEMWVFSSFLQLLS